MSESNGLNTSTTAAPVIPLPQSNNENPTKTTKAPPADTPESLAAMKKAAHLKFDEAAREKKEAAALKAAADKTMAEALSTKAEVEQFIHLASTNPRALEKMYGREKAKKIAEDLLYEMYEEDKLSPEQKAKRDAVAAEKSELEELRADKKKRTEAEEKDKKDRLVKEQGEHIDNLIATAIKDKNVTPTPKIVKRVAEYLEAQLDAGQQLNPVKAVERAVEELKKDGAGYINDMPIEQFVEEYPEKAKQLREFDMKKNAAVPNFQTGFSKPKTEGEKPVAKKSMTIDEAFKRIG